ncbi:MAG: glycosyltransferase family 4 protein [candidate division WOR-3 bacterium]|nr:glycosyltransferase family 4 protein [candidate division WOR-3 bacterium]
MKVGINATILEPNPSGLGNYTINIINHLKDYLVDYIVISSHFESLEIPENKRIIVKKDLRPSLGRFGHIKRWSWLQFRLPDLLRNNQIDILFSTVPEGIISYRFNQVIVVHDLSPLIFPQIYPRLNKYYRYYLPLILKRCVQVISVSQFTKQEIIHYYNIDEKKITVIHEGYDVDVAISNDFENIKKEYNLDNFIICVASELSPRKNLPYLIKAISPLLKKLNHFSLVIVGKIDMRFFPSLQNLISKENLVGKVVFTNYISKEKLYQLYKAASLSIFSSIYEGFGLPILEAMACGTPVVSFKTSSIPEIAGDAAMLVELGDDAGLISAIEKIINDNEYRQKLVEKGIRRVKDFSWQKAAYDIFHLINKIK